MLDIYYHLWKNRLHQPQIRTINVDKSVKQLRKTKWFSLHVARLWYISEKKQNKLRFTNNHSTKYCYTKNNKTYIIHECKTASQRCPEQQKRTIHNEDPWSISEFPGLYLQKKCIITCFVQTVEHWREVNHCTFTILANKVLTYRSKCQPRKSLGERRRKRRGKYWHSKQLW